MSRTTASLSASLLLLAACKGSDHPVETPRPRSILAQVDEQEPNDDSRHAQVLTGTALVHGSFAARPSGDDDWYSLKPSSGPPRAAGMPPVVVKLELSAVKGGDTTLSVYDADRNRLIRVSATAGQPLTLPDLNCRSQCFVELTGKAARTDPEPYTLLVTQSAGTARSELEPNDRAVDAQALPAGGAIDGHISVPEDEDWYRVTTSGLAPGQVLAVIVASPPDVRLELVVVRASDQSVLGCWRASDLGEDIRLPDLAVPAAPETGLLLCVRSAWVAQGKGKPKRTSDPNVAYTIEVQPAPGGDALEVEPNEDAAHATPIDTARPARVGFIAPKGDVDWYVLHAAAPGILHVGLTGVDGLKTVLSLIDPAKKDQEKDNEIARDDSGGLKEPQALAGIAVPAGDSYLRVEGGLKEVDHKWLRDYANPHDPYTLTIGLVPDDGTWEREPNNKPAQATPAQVGHEYRGWIQPAGDVNDWRLDLKDSANVAITVSAVPKLDLRIVVRDANRTGDDGLPALVGMVDKNHVEAEERLVVPFVAGSYLIEISDTGRGANADKPYVLKLQ